AVAVKSVLPEVGAEDVVEAIVVVVANTDRGGPANCLQARLLGDIGERAVAIVLVETIGSARRSVVEARARQQKDIHPAIIVVIKKRAPSSDGLKNIYLGFNTAIAH